MIILNSNIIRTGITLKKRFIFDENYIKRYAKKDKLKWLIIGLSALVLIVIIIVIILVTRNNKPEPVTPAVPRFEIKEELTIESGSDLPEATDYFDVLENIDTDEIEIIYPDEFELSYDTSYCSEDEINEIYSGETPNFEGQDCVEPYLMTPATYGITIILQETEYTVTLNVVDTTAPILTTSNVEIYEGDTYTLEDFVYSCYDVTSECDIAYYTGDTDDEGTEIDYSAITDVGTHTVKIIATDDYGNISDPIEATLTILEVEGELYTITFDSNGGSEIRSRRVGENGNVIRPEDPVREGYTFVGWYLGDEAFDFATEITSDLTLTAHWEEITEEGNGGSGGNGGNTGGGFVDVSSISLNFRTIYLEIGETKTVTARISPSNATNQTVTWSSSNTNVATVSNGNITGVGTGIVTITATAGGKSASVQVNVRQASGGGSCAYGNTTYNTNYVLSVDLTQNGCAINPNANPSESLSTTDYSRLISDLSSLGINATGVNLEHRVDLQKIRNTSGTGLVGYQVVVNVGVIDPDNPYVVLRAHYIIRSDGSRQFLTNNICKYGVCLS